MAEEEITNEQPAEEQAPESDSNAEEASPADSANQEDAGDSGADLAPDDDAQQAAPTAAEQLANDALAAARAAVAGIEDDAQSEADEATTPEESAPAPAPNTSNGAVGEIGSMIGPGSGENAALTTFTPEQLTKLASIEGGEGIDILSDVDLNVKIELGKTRMLVEDVLKLSDGAVVELDKLAGDPVDIYVNERHVARGEVLILNDNFCVRVSEILEATIEER